MDLANMLLCLARSADADAVYWIAREHFSDDEIGEAFAATKGVTIPGQLRLFLERDGRDLCGRFRALAPPRRRFPVQRWASRRLGSLVR